MSERAEVGRVEVVDCEVVIRERRHVRAELLGRLSHIAGGRLLYADGLWPPVREGDVLAFRPFDESGYPFRSGMATVATDGDTTRAIGLGRQLTSDVPAACAMDYVYRITPAEPA